jgi:hypothetical protein
VEAGFCVSYGPCWFRRGRSGSWDMAFEQGCRRLSVFSPERDVTVRRRSLRSWTPCGVRVRQPEVLNVYAS